MWAIFHFGYILKVDRKKPGRVSMAIENGAQSLHHVLTILQASIRQANRQVDNMVFLQKQK